MRFFIRSSDLPVTKRDKIRILLEVVTRDNYQALLREFIVSFLLALPSVTYFSSSCLLIVSGLR